MPHLMPAFQPCIFANSIPLVLGAPAISLTGTVFAQITGNGNNSGEFNIQNTNSGALASTDFIVNADNATSTTNYGDFGINSSTNTDATFTGFAAGDVYIYAATQNLDLAAPSAKNVNFFAGGFLTANKVATFGPTSATLYTTTFDQYGHFSPSPTSTPTIASGACGTGTNGSISGTDQSGLITIGAVATVSCAVTFGHSYATAAKACTFSPATSASASTTVLAYISAISVSGFTLSGSVLASTSFYYHCI